jgi:hypothetical protein
MPEDMPDRVLEDLPARMPEDLPVTKRINVMVGITRSKVFLMTEYIYIYFNIIKPSFRWQNQNLTYFWWLYLH